MRRLIAGLLVAVGISFAPQVVSAHVLVMDETGKQGAIVHIVPDDDPIAGEAAIIYFDRQGASSAGGVVTLAISNEGGERTTVPVKTNNALTTAQYIFPKEGVYELRFTITHDSQEVNFVQSQRVTRGVAGDSKATGSHIWAEGLLVASGVGLLVLGVFFINKRREIKNYSRF